MATIRKKQCLVGQLGNAMKDLFDHPLMDESEEAIEAYAKREVEVGKKFMNLKEVCEVSDSEMVELVKAIIKLYIKEKNEEA